jgi:S1-C subfamily serine protease
MTGQIVGVEAAPAYKGATLQRIRVKLPVEPGASGTPVVDKQGALLGLVQATDMHGTTILIPAAEILAFVKAS